MGRQHIARMVAFCAIASMGTLLIAISMFTPTATAAALYYIYHSTLATALLFLVADLVMERRGGALAPRPPMAQSGLISALFFVGAIAMAGMPPLSGFVGKLLVLDAARDTEWANAVWAVVLIGSFVTIVGLARAGSLVFWKSHDAQHNTEMDPENDEEVEFLPAPRTDARPGLHFGIWPGAGPGSADPVCGSGAGLYDQNRRTTV